MGRGEVSDFGAMVVLRGDISPKMVEGMLAGVLGGAGPCGHPFSVTPGMWWSEDDRSEQMSRDLGPRLCHPEPDPPSHNTEQEGDCLQGPWRPGQ